MSIMAVKGRRKLERRLRGMPRKIQRRVIKSATGFAMTPVLKAAREDAPIGDGETPDGRSRAHLFETLLKKSKLYPSGTAVTVVGNDYAKAPHAHLVHHGTSAHFIPAGRGGFLRIGDNYVSGGVMHSGADPDEYLLDALKANTETAKSRFVTKLKRGLQKYA